MIKIHWFYPHYFIGRLFLWLKFKLDYFVQLGLRAALMITLLLAAAINFSK